MESTAGRHLRTNLAKRTVVVASVVSIIAAALGVNTALPAAAAPFTSGDLVAVRVGDGSAALSTAATQVSLDEFTTSGGLQQSIALPGVGIVGFRRLTLSGTTTSEGALARSADGRYLTLAGYDADVGTPSVSTTSTATVNRIVERI